VETGGSSHECDLGRPSHLPRRGYVPFQYRLDQGAHQPLSTVASGPALHYSPLSFPFGFGLMPVIQYPKFGVARALISGGASACGGRSCGTDRMGSVLARFLALRLEVGLGDMWCRAILTRSKTTGVIAIAIPSNGNGNGNIVRRQDHDLSRQSVVMLHTVQAIRPSKGSYSPRSCNTVAR
jgi:hypothetical protein